MESSPYKRRKLSPTSNVAIDASNTVLNQPQGQREPPASPKRASTYMSPTKASLARFEATLLDGERSVRRGDGASGRSPERNNRSTAAQNGRVTPSRTQLNPTPLRTTPSRSLGRSGATSRRRDRLSATPSRQPLPSRLSASPVRRVNTPQVALSNPASPIRRSNTPEISLSNEQSLPNQVLPMKALPQANETTAKASTTPIVHEEAIVPVEELQEAIVVPDDRREASAAVLRPTTTTTKTKTSSKSGSRRKVIEEPELPPTPTELGLEPPPEPPRGILLSSSPSRKAARRKASNKTSPLKPQDGPIGNGTANAATFTTARKQNGLPEDPFNVTAAEIEPQRPDLETEKQSLRLADLEAQTRLLADDIKVLEEELRRSDTDFEGQPKEDLKRLLSIVALANEVTESNSRRSRQPPISTQLLEFLPFRKPIKNELDDDGDENEDRPIKSLMPMDMDAAALLDIDICTPLNVELFPSDLDSISIDAPDQEVETMQLTSPDGLLYVKLRVASNTTTDRITSLAVTALSPWAEYELGTWLRTTAETRRDILAVSNACGRFWEVANARARYWEVCRQMQKTLDKNDIEESAPLSRCQLQAHLEHDSFLFSNGPASLLVTWAIGFALTGEAYSRIAASVAHPAAWRESDERRSLSKVGRTFDLLIRKRGICEGTRIMTEVLFGK